MNVYISRAAERSRCTNDFWLEMIIPRWLWLWRCVRHLGTQSNQYTSHFNDFPTIYYAQRDQWKNNLFLWYPPFKAVVTKLNPRHNVYLAQCLFSPLTIDYWLWWLFFLHLFPPLLPCHQKGRRRRRKCFGWDCCFYKNNENTFTTSSFCFCRAGNNILPQTRLPLLLLAGTNKRRSTLWPTKLFFENRLRRMLLLFTNLALAWSA